jgi:hypothetical protein
MIYVLAGNYSEARGHMSDEYPELGLRDWLYVPEVSLRGRRREEGDKVLYCVNWVDNVTLERQYRILRDFFLVGFAEAEFQKFAKCP